MKEIVMSDLLKFIDAVKAKNGNPCSLRSVFPGRGKLVTAIRANIKSAVGSGYDIEDAEGNGDHKISFDAKTGVYYYN
jgi:hypothetical protein